MTFAARVDALRDGIRIKTLPFRAEEPPDISCALDAEIHTSLSGSFLPDPDIDLYAVELRPVIVIDGIECRCGIFRPATVTRHIDSTGESVNITAYDRGWQVQCKRTSSLLHLSAGTNYVDAVRELLSEAGIALVIASPTDETLQTDREDWDIGTDYLTIINQLLGEINYGKLWFDADGIARVQPESVTDAAMIRWRYSANDIRGSVSREAQQTTDIFGAANHFIVVCSNPDLDAPMVAEAVNDSPQSATSTVRRGMKISELVHVDNIASQSALQAYADALARQSRVSPLETTVYTLHEPGHGVGDIVSCVHPELSGICVEAAWSMTLSHDRLMSHTLRKEVYAT